MDYQHIIVLWTCTLWPDLHLCFNFDKKNYKIFHGSIDAQFGYTVQQHEAGGHQWLLVGAPFEYTGQLQTGDVYKCPLDIKSSANCSRLDLGKLSLDNVTERKDRMGLGMTLTSNSKDNSFVTCGPLWSHECGSSLYSTGICTKANWNFRLTQTFAPALQRCETFMDIVIVLDGSNSIYPWYEVQDFIINILQRFYIGPGQTQVGVVQYGSTVVHEFSLGEYQTVEDVLDAARNIDQRGGEETRTALGINVARSEAFQRGGRSGAQKVMIVITDGESHDSPQLMEAVSQSKRENITMYAIAVLGYYNRRGINPETFLKEIKFIASDPDEEHFFKVTDESALKDIVDALGERIFYLEGISSQGRGFDLQMAQAGFSSHLVNDGVLLGAVGAYDWNGAVLKKTKHGKVFSPKSSYKDEFPEALKNHAAYLGYSVDAVISPDGSQLYIAGAPRFNHTGKVIIFTMKNNGNLTILQALLGQQIGSYFGSGLLSMDIDEDGQTDFLMVAAPMYYNQGLERGRVYIYSMSLEAIFIFHGVLEVSHHSQNSRLGSALAQIADMNGDGFKELVVGAPLEDDHQGAIYIFHSKDKMIGPHYKQRLSGAVISTGLQYFGQSLHGVLDVNGDGLVDLAVGALGAVIIIWSRGVVRIDAKMTFEPEKINIFNKNCQRGGKEVTCMSVAVCLRVDSRIKTKQDNRNEVAVWYSLVFDEKRFPPWAVMDESHRQQPRTLFLHTGNQKCEYLGFFVQDIADYRRPIVVVMEAGLQSQDKGPVLDPDWPTTLRTELPFWNGCEGDTCIPDLILHSHTDLLNVLQFCSTWKHATYSLCNHQKGDEEKVFVFENGRRKITVFAQLENRGENAYRATLNISTTPNLLFSSLLVKEQSDIQIECSTENRTSSLRSCNISAPFMRSLAQVTFHLELEISRSIFLDFVQLSMVTTSEGKDGYPDDNTNNISLPLKYQADLLFTRDPNPHRFEIRGSLYSSSEEEPDTAFPAFNLTFNVWNMGIFLVKDIMLKADIWAVTKEGNQLVAITDYSIEEQGTDSSCMLPHTKTTILGKPEDLTNLSQLNYSNSVSILLQCRLSLSPSKGLKLTFIGRLQLPALHAVSFRSLELLTVASIQLEKSNPMFLQEDNLVIQLGFFKTQRREEEEEQPVTNGKAEKQL
ncbi:integrin alpha-11-like isoform X2 [Girardinichthys multiradiatus]|uniref:integrin alpha-11-like isoform X2 n=1 Tax=Girardinichthys multiradiatus TaxID=208333 RepID=UPI001FAE539E|nr:integrin alpha-11-like isoform X2 [Girardinichthys multiradiatus]